MGAGAPRFLGSYPPYPPTHFLLGALLRESAGADEKEDAEAEGGPRLLGSYPPYGCQVLAGAFVMVSAGAAE